MFALQSILRIGHFHSRNHFEETSHFVNGAQAVFVLRATKNQLAFFGHFFDGLPFGVKHSPIKRKALNGRKTIISFEKLSQEYHIS